ncbi:hypothetical protein [Sphaerisporangium fuscum]|uniref:hypothetical protein n=1 Tax=Sphaerisporangium fuscum TaxID=2835868 RepID=UPI003FD6E9DC
MREAVRGIPAPVAGAALLRRRRGWASIWPVLVCALAMVLLGAGPARATAYDGERAAGAPARGGSPTASYDGTRSGTAGASSTSLPGSAAHVLLIGVPGLQWADLSQAGTPNLWALVGRGASASMSTRAYPAPNRPITCPVAGWLTVSAGQRAGSGAGECALPSAPQVAADGSASVPGWAELASYNAATSYRAAIGLLGQAVRDAGGSVAAVGAGAALGAADKSGKIAKYADDVRGLGDPARYNLIVADVDDLARAWLTQPAAATTAPAPDLTRQARAQAAASADRRVGEILKILPAGATTLVAGLSDASPAAHLHTALATGPSPPGKPYGHGHLTASSTRQEALVTVTDLTTTVADLLDVTLPEGTVGRPWTPAGSAPAAVGDTVRELADADLASRVLVQVRAPFYAVFVTVQLIFYGLAALAVRRRRGGPRVLVAMQVLAVASGAVAVSTFLAQLVPWWNLAHPMVALIATIVGFAALLAALAFAGPWRAHVLGPLGVVGGLTSLALLIDVATGSRLQVNAVTGYEPVTGGRFYGFSNIAFAVYATGTILALAAVAQALIRRGRRVIALAVCLAYGLLAIFADGWPGWGADFGGVPAFVLGFAVFAMMLAGLRVTVGKLVIVAAAGAVLISAIAVADWLRPAEQRTHLGAFVQQVIDGEGLPVIGRKLGAMLGTLGNWQLTLLSLAALAFLYLVLARPSEWGASALSLAYAEAPALRAALFGVLTTALVGFLINDSGIAIPAMALTVAVPLTLAASIRALQRSSVPTTPARRSAPAEAPEPPRPAQ